MDDNADIFKVLQPLMKEVGILRAINQAMFTRNCNKAVSEKL